MAVGEVGCGLTEGCGAGAVFGPVVLGAGVAGGSAGGRETADEDGPEADAEAVPPDGLDRVAVADACDRAVAALVTAIGTGEAGAPGVDAASCEGDSGPVAAGATAPSE